MPISAVDCVQPALQHTRQQLFSRFRWGQWSRLALVGILAAELHVASCNFGNFGGSWPKLPHKNPGELLPSSSVRFGLPQFNPAHLPEHLGELLGLIVIAILAAMVLSFVFLYLNSVFRFILFDAVLRRECSIREGWQKWRRAGGRFFAWQIVLQIAVWLFLLVAVVVPVALAFAAGWISNPQEHIVPLVLGAVLLIAVAGLFLLAMLVVQTLARDFLVPIMALEDVDFADGWHALRAKIRVEKGRFAVYLLLKLVLAMAAAILFSILAVIPALAVVIPGVAAVVAGHAAGMGWNVTTVSLAIILGSVLIFLLLYLIALVCVPGTVFFPAYGLHFLAARYPRLDGLLNPLPPAQEPPAPPPWEAPPLPPSTEPIG